MPHDLSRLRTRRPIAGMLALSLILCAGGKGLYAIMVHAQPVSEFTETELDVDWDEFTDEELETTFTGAQSTFVENVGQADPNVNYMIDVPQPGGARTRVFVGDNITYVTATVSYDENAKQPPLDPEHEDPEAPPVTTMEMVAVREIPVNGSLSDIGGDGETAEVRNYFIGDVEQTNVQTYKNIIANDVWDGIDIDFGGRGGFKETYRVNPGGNPGDLVFDIEGADSLELDLDGNLHINTAAGSLTKEAPYAYQLAEDDTQGPVSAVFEILSPMRYRVVVGIYDPSRTLYVDPLLGGTFIGDTASDKIVKILREPVSGDVFVTGCTLSPNFPAGPVGVIDSSQNGNVDVFVSRFSPDLRNVRASTFIGGSGEDGFGAYCDSRSLDMAIGANGKIYLAGSTTSPDFPIKPGALDGTFNATSETFLLRMHPDLNVLEKSTFLQSEPVTPIGQYVALTVDGANNVYVAGSGKATGRFGGGFGHPDPAREIYDRYFVAKFNADLTLLASAKWGDNIYGPVNEIALDAAGNVFVTSSVASYPVSGGSAADHPYASLGVPGFDQTSGSSPFSTKGVILKFNNSLSALLGYTHLGALPSNTVINDMIIGADNYVYVTGVTDTPNFPIRPGAYQPTKGNAGWGGGCRTCYDAFVSKISNDLGTLEKSTYLGSTSTDGGYGIALSADGSDVYVTGTTGQGGGGTSLAAVGDVNDTSTKAGGFIARMNNALSSVELLTVMGPVSWPAFSPADLALDPQGNVFAAGTTYSCSTRTTPGAFQTIFGGDADGFIMKLDKDFSPGGLYYTCNGYDLVTGITRAPTAFVAGANGVYTVTVYNNGSTKPAGLVNTSVSITLPPRFSYVSATSTAGSGWSCSALGQVVTCNRNNMAAIAVRGNAPPITLTVLAAPGPTETVTTTATVSTGAGENADTSANNTLTDTVTVTGVRGPVTFMLYPRNNGPQEAGNVMITIPLPAELRFSSAKLGGANTGICSVAGSQLVCNYGPLFRLPRNDVSDAYRLPSNGLELTFDYIVCLAGNSATLQATISGSNDRDAGNNFSNRITKTLPGCP